MKKLVKKFFLSAVLALVPAVTLFAQGLLPAGMSTLMQEILTVVVGDFVQGILVVCLCGCAVAYGFNKDNEKMKRNIIAIAIAIAILVAASNIVEAVWKAAKG